MLRLVSSGSPVFEPVDEFKGDVALALYSTSPFFAMNMDETFGSSVMTEKSQFKPWAIEELKNGTLGPGEPKERDRNNIIHSLFQFNRNPLIDHPEIVTLIWGSDSLYSTFNSPHNEATSYYS